MALGTGLGKLLGNHLLKLGVEPFNFAKKNTIVQAIWTYVIWSLIVFVVAWILMMILIKVAPRLTVLVLKIYSLVAVGYIGLKMLKANNAKTDNMARVKVLIAVVLSFFFMYYVGLLLLALFTTEKFHLLKDPKNMIPDADGQQEQQQEQQEENQQQ